MSGPSRGKAADPLEGTLKVLNTATCPSLSGKSELTYQIAADEEARVYLRIHANTGGGFFSPEWVPLDAIEKAIEKAPKERPLSALTLQPLFHGRSVNTPAFLLAALVQEKWLRVLKGKKRGVEAVDSAAFQTKIKRLTQKSPTEKKPPVKRKPPARKKK